jgi:hypothetical protein
MNPTVSDRRILRFEGKATDRRVGSSVANIRGDSSTVALVSALNNVDFLHSYTHERDGSNRHRLAPLALLGANPPHVFNLLLQMPNATIDFTAICLQLGLARSSGSDAAAKLGHFDTPSGKPGQHVFQLRKFDLKLAFRVRA